MTPTVVLVHGAYHDGSCWSLVQDRLTRAAIVSYAVNLPFDSFAGDCAAVRAAVTAAKANGPVLLVGHSYSGLVVSVAGHAADRLLYVAARMPAAGEIPADTEGWTLSGFRAAVTATPDGATMLSSSAAELLYNTTDPTLRHAAQQAWRPMRSQVPDHPIPDPAWTRVRTRYVVCAQDRVVNVAAQRAVAARADDASGIDCDHSPFFSAPAELTAIVEREVSAMSAKPRFLTAHHPTTQRTRSR